MYVPEWFRITDPEFITAFLRANSFATLVSVMDGRPFATHVPLVVVESEPLVLVGHVAAQNPQSATFDGDQVSMAVFHGPHSYVSPRDYATSPNVPTWNYVAVHAYGRPRRIDDAEDALAAMGQLVRTFDPDLDQSEPESASPEFWRSKLKGIVAFRMEVEELEAKGKLSQNKPERDQESVIAALRSQATDEARAVADLMTGQ